MRPFDPLFILEVLPALLPYLSITLMMMLGTVILGGILGFLLARAKLSQKRVFRLIANGYTGAMRCTPSVVLLFIVYYGLPELVMTLFQVNINFIYKGIFVLITFTLLFAASMSEVMRSAYQAVDRGQREAALSIGLTEAQCFFRVTLPQAVVFALPNFGNSLITLMKEGSLAYTIGLIDIMGQGTLIISRNYGAHALETYIALAIVYWTLTLLFQRTFTAIERRLSRGRKSVAA